MLIELSQHSALSIFVSIEVEAVHKPFPYLLRVFVQSLFVHIDSSGGFSVAKIESRFEVLPEAESVNHLSDCLLSLSPIHNSFGCFDYMYEGNAYNGRILF